MTAHVARPQRDDPIRNQPARLARLMNLPKSAQMSDLRIADAIAAGLPVSAFEAMAEMLKPVDEDAMFKVVSESTYRRARKARPMRFSRDASERIYDLARVLDEALAVFHGDRTSAIAFLRSRHQLLDGRTPFDVARSSTAGANAVVTLLRQARAGVAV